jgi:hypothetical protein
MAFDVHRFGIAISGLPSAAVSHAHRHAPAVQLRNGRLSSSAWEGWWSEETQAELGPCLNAGKGGTGDEVPRSRPSPQPEARP